VDIEKLQQRSKELDHLRAKIVALLALLVQQSDLGINDEGRIDRLFCLWVDRCVVDFLSLSPSLLAPRF